MSPAKRVRRRRVVSYPPDAVMTIQELAKALGVSKSTIEREDLPAIWIGKRLKRYCWGQVLDVLKKRAV